MQKDERERALTWHSFLQQVKIGPECWEWVGSLVKDRGGYGRFCVGGKTVRAHRWLYQQIHGPVSETDVIMHLCDNPSCVNPAHLRLGTYSENTRDMVAKGRGQNRQGEKHPLARLTAEDIAKIRHRAEMGISHHRIAIDFKISRQHVGKIVRRENWGHV